jgi:hypothetical protein
MEQRPFLEIETIDKDLLESVKEQNGRLPDNFVDSAEGADAGLPDVRSDPAARNLLEQVDADIAVLLEGSGDEEEG